MHFFSHSFNGTGYCSYSDFFHATTDFTMQKILYKNSRRNSGLQCLQGSRLVLSHRRKGFVTFLFQDHVPSQPQAHGMEPLTLSGWREERSTMRRQLQHDTQKNVEKNSGRSTSQIGELWLLHNTRANLCQSWPSATVNICHQLVCPAHNRAEIVQWDRSIWTCSIKGFSVASFTQLSLSL